MEVYSLWVISNTIFLKWSTQDWSTLQKSVQKIQTKRLQKIIAIISLYAHVRVRVCVAVYNAGYKAAKQARPSCRSTWLTRAVRKPYKIYQ